jgi:hypothetical protein
MSLHGNLPIHQPRGDKSGVNIAFLDQHSWNLQHSGVPNLVIKHGKLDILTGDPIT